MKIKSQDLSQVFKKLIPTPVILWVLEIVNFVGEVKNLRPLCDPLDACQLLRAWNDGKVIVDTTLGKMSSLYDHCNH